MKVGTYSLTAGPMWYPHILSVALAQVHPTLPICRPTTCDFVGLMKILGWWDVLDDKSLQSGFCSRSVGLMDKALAPGAGDSRFESWADH